MQRSRNITVVTVVAATVVGARVFGQAETPVAGAGTGAAVPQITIVPGRTTILRVEPEVGRPLEREPDLLAQVPSLRRALELDRDQRWADAAASYQQAMSEIGLGARFASASLMERAAFKVDLERRRSRALAQIETPDQAGEPVRTGSRGTTPSLPMPALDRARLLRLKLMTIRSGTGSVPAGLVSMTLATLLRSLYDRDSHAGRDDDDTAEIRLLLCATRAVAGDRMGARMELAHVRTADRTAPARALPMAVCQAALGYNDEALASLAVAVYRLGPSPRFLPGQTRELESGNDWDVLRIDPRFERLFR